MTGQSVCFCSLRSARMSPCSSIRSDRNEDQCGACALGVGRLLLDRASQRQRRSMEEFCRLQNVIFQMIFSTACIFPIRLPLYTTTTKKRSSEVSKWVDSRMTRPICLCRAHATTAPTIASLFPLALWMYLRERISAPVCSVLCSRQLHWTVNISPTVFLPRHGPRTTNFWTLTNTEISVVAPSINAFTPLATDEHTNTLRKT